MNNHFYIDGDGTLNTSRPSLSQSYFHLDREVSLEEANTRQWHTASSPNLIGDSFTQGILHTVDGSFYPYSDESFSLTLDSFPSGFESIMFANKPKKNVQNVLSEPKLPNI